MLWQVYTSFSGVLIRSDLSAAPITLAKLQNPVKQGFDSLNGDLKKIHKSLNDFSKALDKVCILGVWCVISHICSVSRTNHFLLLIKLL